MIVSDREPIALSHLFDIDFEIGRINTLGVTPKGTRIIADLGGGRFEGERLRGRILPSGGDWGLFMPDGTLRVDGRCCFETDDGTILYGIYKGRWKIAPEMMARLGEQGGVDPSEYYLRIGFEFEAPIGDYDWMNHLIAIARGQRVEEGIRYEVFEVL
ncbi:MAG: DUF3237 domain-containing protein [bacterium]|nr:DUF3237 domain-containing protein [bacterium]